MEDRYLELYFTCTWYKYFIGLQRRQTCFQVFQAPRHTPVDAFVTFHERLKSALSTFQLPADADNLAWLKMPIKSSDLASPAFRSLQSRSLLHWRGRNRMGSSRKHELAMYIMASNLRILDPQQECKVRLFLTRNHHHGTLLLLVSTGRSRAFRSHRAAGSSPTFGPRAPWAKGTDGAVNLDRSDPAITPGTFLDAARPMDPLIGRE